MHKYACKTVNPIPIDHIIDNSSIKKLKENLKCLGIMFSTLKVLAKQNIALRGSNHDEGNYIEILKLQALHVDEIKDK